MNKYARRIALCLALCLAPACGPSTPTPPAPAGDVCADAARCEAAIVAAKPAEVEALVDAYATRHAPGWDRVLAAMADEHAVVGETVPWPGDPKAVSADALLVALGRAKGRAHLLVVAGRARILFPRDALGSVAGFVTPVLSVDPAQRDVDLTLVGGVEKAFAAADAFDYVAAADAADALQQRLRAGGGSREVVWRTRLALDRMHERGLALQVPEEEELPDLDATAAGLTPYGDLIALRLHGTDDGDWETRKARILAGVPEDRRAALRQHFTPAATCPDPFVPPMKRPDDLVFAARYATILDPEAGPGEPPSAGMLGLAEWTKGYLRMVELVESGHPWLHLGSLLQERGELDGLSAASGATYKRVSALGKKHIEALRKLVMARPARFDALGLVSLVYRPGALKDPLLRQALAALVRDAVKQKLAVAHDPAEVFDDAAVAFMTATSLPGPIQAAQLTALREALDDKLGGDFGRGSGWALTALHAGHAITGLIFEDPAWLQRAAGRIDRSLEGELPYPHLAALVRAGTTYVELSVGGTLDADVLNPVQFPLVRTEARRKLQTAVEGLAEEGPKGAKEKALARLVTDMGDGLIALAAATLSRKDDGPRCDDGTGVAHQTSWQRMRQRQKRLLRDPIFAGKSDGAWTRRVRLLGLVLSDLTDLLAPGPATATVPGGQAQAIAQQGLKGWVEGPVATSASAGYLLARRLAGGELEGDAVLEQSVALLAGLSELFEEDGRGLFGTLAAIGKEVEGSASQGDLGSLFAAYADRAYEAKADSQGDLLLLIALSVNLSKEEPAPRMAIDVARNHDRPVLLPLLMYQESTDGSLDPAPLLTAMKQAAQHGCAPPDPAMVIAVRRAIYDFGHGERESAIRRLERVVDDARQKGLVVPRQTYSYLQRTGTRYLKALQSISLGAHLLENSGTFNVGLGYVSGGPEGGEIDVQLSGATTPDALKEAARYYAHAAALSAAYHFALGEDDAAVASARTAVGAWANGVKLGDRRIPVGGETALWAKDATATIAVIAQRAAERGHALLAGDLWTLARASLAPEAQDDDIAAILDPPPPSLRGVPELKPIIARARETLKVVAAPLACTKANVDLTPYADVGCEDYPGALALRVADALPKLPRLEKGAEVGHPGCQAWRKLDTFLEAVDAGRYEPKAFEAAVGALDQYDHHQDAATLMARQRHPKHCTPAIVDQARAMSKRQGLGLHLRADVLSVAANCAAATPSVDNDLLALDELTRDHALPTRNFELMIFAARIALAAGRYDPLYRLTHQPNFIRRYQRLGPDLAAAALLLHHASAAGAEKPVGAEETAAARRLVCATYAEPRRATMCNVISQLTDEETSNPKAVAKDALERFVEEALRQGGT